MEPQSGAMRGPAWQAGLGLDWQGAARLGKARRGRLGKVRYSWVQWG